MRYLRILFFLVFSICSFTANAANFVEGMDDVPLPEGLKQITQENVSFGNEETRLLEAYFSSRKMKFKQISDFYKETLPQLGWIYQGNRKENLLFYREGETLEVVRESVSPLIVRITVKTKP